MSADEPSRSTTSIERPDDPSQPIEPEQSLGELLGRVSRDFSELVSTQVELAKVELQEEIAAAGRGAGILTGGALCALLAVVLLSFAAAWCLLNWSTQHAVHSRGVSGRTVAAARPTWQCWVAAAARARDLLAVIATPAPG
jgi:hypothetical protein